MIAQAFLSDTSADGLVSLARDNVELSLGVVADVLWAMLPELRPRLRRLALDELDSAIENDDLPGYPSRFDVMSEFIGHVLSPAIEPAGDGRIAKQVR